MLNTTEIPSLASDRDLVTEWQKRLPELLQSDNQTLVAALREIMEPAMNLFTNHLEITGQAGGAVQLLSTICEERLDDRSLALTLLGSLGDVDSAAPSFALWELGRKVAHDTKLTDLFNQGIPDLEERLRNSYHASDFVEEFDTFLS